METGWPAAVESLNRRWLGLNGWDQPSCLYHSGSLDGPLSVGASGLLAVWTQRCRHGPAKTDSQAAESLAAF